MTAALRCEACGYDLAGLEVEDACPECARPVAANSRERPGSPWQRAPSLETWLKTGARVCTRPGTLWSEIELEFPRSWNLLLANLAAGAFLVGAGMASGVRPGSAMGSLMGAVLITVPLFGLLFLLTMLCMAVVRVLSGAGSMPVRTAVAHASVLWLLAAPAAVVAVRLPVMGWLLLIAPAGVVWLGAIGARRLCYAPEPVA